MCVCYNPQNQVEVGANLLKIDTAGTPSAPAAPAPAASASAPSPATPAPPSPATAPAVAVANAPSSHAGKRTPLIKFLGKRSLLAKTAGHAPSSAVAPAAAMSPPPVRYEDIKGTPGAKLFNELPPLFGRPALSPQEVAAIESGGAD